VNLHTLMGTGGVDSPVLPEELRRRGSDGWDTTDYDTPRPGAGTVEDHMNAHKKYLTETLKGQLRS
jgi:hypothetical protein